MISKRTSAVVVTVAALLVIAVVVNHLPKDVAKAASTAVFIGLPVLALVIFGVALMQKRPAAKGAAAAQDPVESKARLGSTAVLIAGALALPFVGSDLRAVIMLGALLLSLILLGIAAYRRRSTPR